MGRVLCFLVFVTTATCVYGREKSHVVGGGDDDIAGPIVKSHSGSGLSVVPISANVTLLSNATLSEEKKKTIAQIIDEALEQEFPEEKPEKIGKNYNETALQQDVRSLHTLPIPVFCCFASEMSCALSEFPDARHCMRPITDRPWHAGNGGDRHKGQWQQEAGARP